jgi:hypothetical protein
MRPSVGHESLPYSHSQPTTSPVSHTAAPMRYAHATPTTPSTGTISTLASSTTTATAAMTAVTKPGLPMPRNSVAIAV